jgi:neutral ceramidase
MRFSMMLLAFMLCIYGLTAAAEFQVGFAQRDITPEKPIPMWGYGARHALPGEQTLDPLYAKALVLSAGGTKMALVGLDLGRGPTYAMMEAIEKKVKETSGVECVMAVGSHTHHGPVIELLDQPGMGQDKHDDAVEYAQSVAASITEAINEAAGSLADARMGVAVRDTDFNRNRHAKEKPKPRDPELAVLRFDTLAGDPIAIMVNLAAHPTIHSVFDRSWTSEWPGKMQQSVESELGTHCFFMQGAAGDLSPNTNSERKGIDGFGKAVAGTVIEMARNIETTVPETPAIQHRTDWFEWQSRLDLYNPLVQGALKQAFFPEMMAMLVEIPENRIRGRLTTVLLNGELALAGGSGEFFCDHANRLKTESPAKETIFFGYCNGHNMYYPTEKGVEQGGYGADSTVAWVPADAGRTVIDKAIENIRAMLGSDAGTSAAAP